VKKPAFVVLLFIVTAIASRAEVRFGGGAHGGLSFSSISGPLNEFYGLGFGGGIHADLDVVRYLTLRLNVDYSAFPSDKDKWRNLLTGGAPLNITVEGANLSIIGITMNAVGKIPTGSVVTPYGIIGMGLHIGSGSDLKVLSGGQTVLTVPVESGTNFGLNFGAGSEFRVGYSKLFLEAKYVLIFNKGNNIAHIPITFGVVF
jgi:hypothetical protein